jgi:3-hydroxyacyl-[acyl-carrier-protein] dehydratase
MLLDGILLRDAKSGLIAAVKEVRHDDWWAKAHIPGRPLMPGVLMIEAAAQLASYFVRADTDEQRFLGFAALDNTKFRGTVTPPADVVIINRLVSLKTRRFVMDSQAFVENKMVFEARITGMIV